MQYGDTFMMLSIRLGDVQYSEGRFMYATMINSAISSFIKCNKR